MVVWVNHKMIDKKDVQKIVRETVEDRQFGATASSSLNFSRPTDSFNYYFIEKHKGLFGIGSSTPWGRLSVEQGTSTDPVLVVGDMGTSTTILGASSSPHFLINPRGFVGIATASPTALLTIGSSTAQTVPTSTIFFDSELNVGSCLVMKDEDGTGYSYLTVSDGVLTVRTTSCQ